jgi:hypothetical protein
VPLARRANNLGEYRRRRRRRRRRHSLCRRRNLAGKKKKTRGRLERGVLFAPEVRGVAVRVTRSNGRPQDAVLTGEVRAFRDAQLSDAYNLAAAAAAAETGDAKRRSTSSTTVATAPPRVHWTLEVEWQEPEAAERKSKPRLMLKNVPAHDIATALGRANPLSSTLVPPSPTLVAHASTGEAKNRHNAELSRRLLPPLQTSFVEAWIGPAAPRRRVAPAAVVAIAASPPPRAVALPPPPPRSRVTSPRVVAPRSRVSLSPVGLLRWPTSSELDPTQLPDVLLCIMGGYVATTDYVDAAANPEVRALGAKLRAVDRVACGNNVCAALLRSGATLEQLRRERGDLDDDEENGGGGEKDKRPSSSSSSPTPTTEEEGGGDTDDEGKEEKREAAHQKTTVTACAPRCTDRLEALTERIHKILWWNRHLNFVWIHVRYELPEAAATIFQVTHLDIFHRVFSNFGQHGSIEDAELVVMCPPGSSLARALSRVISETRRIREGVIVTGVRDAIDVVWETDNCTREGMLEEGAAVWLAVLYYLTSFGAAKDSPGRIEWIEAPKEVLSDARFFGTTLATITGADPAAPFDVRVGVAPFADTPADEEDEDVVEGDEEEDDGV